MQTTISDGSVIDPILSYLQTTKRNFQFPQFSVMHNTHINSNSNSTIHPSIHTQNRTSSLLPSAISISPHRHLMRHHSPGTLLMHAAKPSAARHNPNLLPSKHKNKQRQIIG